MHYEGLPLRPSHYSAAFFVNGKGVFLVPFQGRHSGFSDFEDEFFTGQEFYDGLPQRESIQ